MSKALYLALYQKTIYDYCDVLQKFDKSYDYFGHVYRVLAIQNLGYIIYFSKSNGIKGTITTKNPLAGRVTLPGRLCKSKMALIGAAIIHKNGAVFATHDNRHGIIITNSYKDQGNK